MSRCFLFIFLFISLFSTDIFAQNHSFDSNLPQTIIKKVKNDTGKLYELIITLPPDYHSENEYSVLYYLDAWWLRDLVPGCYRIKSLSNKSLANNMHDVILVGISSVGNEIDWNRQRNMDYTPSKFNNNYTFNNGAVPLDETTTGGAEEFIEFLKAKVFKSIENEYKIKSSTRGILGHSLGGLFGFYAYMKYPELFSNYILIAPSIWWNQSELLVDKESLISKTEANMFVAMGTNEIKLMKAPMPIFVQELSQQNNPKLTMVYRQYENEDHHSVLPQSIYDALEFIYTNNNND